MKPNNSHADKLPPHSDDSEAGILACALLDPAAVMPSIVALPPELFYDLRNRALFGVLCEMHKAGLGIDTLSVFSRLKSCDKLQDAGGLEYVSTMPDKAPSAANLPTYLHQAQEAFAKRQALATAADVSEAITAGHPVANVIHHAAKSFTDCERFLPGNTTRNGLSMRQPDDILSMTFDDADNYLGDRLLAAGQYMTLLGPGGIGKSRMLLQMAGCTITGRPFLGFETRAPGKRWLILQAENSNRRLSFDLAALRAWIGPKDWPAVNDALVIHTLETDADGFMALDDPATVARIGDAIRQHQPDIIGLDSLYNFAIGDLNADREMRETLTAISRLSKAGNPHRALVVLHHALTGRAGAAKATGYDRASFGRNSKVLQSWTRGQINIAPGSADDNDTLVLTCGKTSNGREFAPFAIHLDPASMIYEPAQGFDFAAWQSDIAGTKTGEPLMTPERVRELCGKPTTKAELARLIRDDCGCPRTASYRYIIRGEQSGKIKFNKANETYTSR